MYGNVRGCTITGHAARENYTLLLQPLDLYNGWTLEDCFNVCKEDTRCVSFNYAIASGQCEILDVNHCYADQFLLQRDGYTHFAMLCLPDLAKGSNTKISCLQSELCTEECKEVHIEVTSARHGTNVCGGGGCLPNMECDVNVCRCEDGYLLGTNRTCVKDSGHIGTDFVLAFGDNFKFKSSEELVLLVSTYSHHNVSLHVMSPAMMNNITRHVLPGECTKILLPDIRVTTYGVIESRGIRVIATGRISVTAVNGKYKGTDAFGVPPIEYAATNYHVVSPTADNTFYIQLLIVSSENVNSVSFTTPAISTFSAVINDKTYGPSETFNLILNELETYRVLSESDLSGMTVNSEKPTVVTAGSPAFHSPGLTSSDILEASLPGIQTLGKSHIIFSSPLDMWRPKSYKLNTVEPNTNIQIFKGDGNISVSLGKSGSSFEFRLMDKTGSVISDKPIIVVGYTESNPNDLRIGDPSSIVVPSLEQFSKTDLRFQTINRPEARYPSWHHLTVAIQKQYVSGLLLDGVHFAKYRPKWLPVPGLQQYLTTSMQVSHRSHVLSHETGHPSIFAVCYGFYQAESYSYVIGRNYRKLD